MLRRFVRSFLLGIVRKRFRVSLVPELLYAAKFFVGGYLFGRTVFFHLSLCRVIGNSMHPTLHSDRDIVLLWNVESIKFWRNLAYFSKNNHVNPFFFLPSLQNPFSSINRCVTSPSDASSCEGAKTQNHHLFSQGSVYVLWHPSKEYKMIKRVKMIGHGVFTGTDNLFSGARTQKIYDSTSRPDSSSYSKKICKKIILTEQLGEEVVQHKKSFSDTPQKTNRFGYAFDEKLPPGYIWVQGDNPMLSEDSRSYGALPVTSVVAKAVAIVWPPDRIALLPTLTTQ